MAELIGQTSNYGSSGSPHGQVICFDYPDCYPDPGTGTSDGSTAPTGDAPTSSQIEAGKVANTNETLVNGQYVVEKIAFDNGVGGFYRSVGATIDYATGAIYINPADSLQQRDYTVERSLDGEAEFSDANGEQTSDAGTWLVNQFGDSFGDGAQVRVAYEEDNLAPTTVVDQHPVPPVEFELNPGFAEAIVPGSIRFTWGTEVYIDRSGKILRDLDHENNSALEAGFVNYKTGIVTLTDYIPSSSPITVESLLTTWGEPTVVEVFFRTPGAPLRPGGLSLTATAVDGTELLASTDFDGNITGTKVRGFVDWQSGVVRVEFGEVDAGAWVPQPIVVNSIRYNAVIFTFIPLDPAILGLDPVRLPLNGRVPVFRAGDVAVLHNTQSFTMTDPLSADAVENVGRTDLELIELFDSNGAKVAADQYSVDLVTGDVTMASAPTFDLSSYFEPLIAQHRIAQMFLVSDVEIGGRISTGAAIARDYPVAGTYLSSALIFGDLQSRVEHFFSQETWTGVWDDERIGSNTTAQYNDLDFPVQVQNDSAIDQRWAVIFTSATTFNLVGETVGQIASGNTSTDLEPVNISTGKIYFTLLAAGWGSGWSTGDVVRFNTVGANAPIWAIRTTLQGPPEEPDDQFILEIRGDADV